MRILAIDPGTEQSGWVLYDPQDNEVQRFGVTPNGEFDRIMRDAEPEYAWLAIEMVACYGMSVGKSTFETCVWIGRFIERWDYYSPHCEKPEDIFVYRRDVKLFLCNSARAKDGNVSQAIRDKFPRTGGGKTPQVGTKDHPGPLYGVKGHIWSALGVALTFANRIEQGENR